MNCKHGIDENYCAICNGTVAKRTEEQKQFFDAEVRRREYIVKRKKLQEDSRMFAKRHKEDVTDEDISYVLVNTVEVEKEEVNTLFNIAKKLERTLHAIEWVYKYAWDENITEFIKNADDNKWYLRIQRIKEGLGL